MAKAKELDMSRFMALYKAFYNTQLKFNKERLAKLERSFAALETKLAETEARNEKRTSDATDNLRDLHTKLNALLSRIDDPEADFGDEEALAQCVVQSNEFLGELRNKRERDLEKVADEHRKNVDSLKKAFEVAEARKDKRLQQLRDKIASTSATDIGASTSKPSTFPSPDKNKANVGWTDEDRARVTEYNKSVYEMNKDAYNQYIALKDQVSESRAQAYKEAAEKNEERRQALEKARINRAVAIKEREHKWDLKRYREAVVHADKAKRRKMDTSGKGDNYAADSLTVSGGAPQPQLVVVKDHFRKAKILSGVPDRTLEKLKDSIQYRWEDFVQSMFLTVTIIDEHGVKTWALNDAAVVTGIMAPFLQLRYGVKYAWSKSETTKQGGGGDPRAQFFEACDDLITGLLVNNNAGLVLRKELLGVFREDTEDTNKVVYSGIEHAAERR